MKKISSALFSNLGWKFISLLLAVVLWFICMNVDNPAESKLFTLTLTLENERKISENNYTLLNEVELRNRQISVRIRASRNTLAELNRRQNSLRAYIDLSPVDILSQNLGTPQVVAVLLDIPLSAEDYEITYQSPNKVNVTVDRYVTEVKTIEVDRKGEAMETYLSGKAEIEAAFIGVTGAQTVLSQIDSVRVQVDLTGAKSDVEVMAPIRVYDVDNNDITDQVKLSQDEIYVRVPVSKYARLSISTPRISGSVAEGYVVTDVTMEPARVEVVGGEEEVSRIPRIELPPINISGYTETGKFPFDLRLYLPDNVAIRNGTSHEAIITVVIEKETVRELMIPVEKLHIVGMTTGVDWTVTEVPLVIRGVESNVNILDPESLYGTLNVSGLSTGRHQVAVQFQLPDGIVQLEETFMEINVAESVGENISSPPESEDPDEPIPTEEVPVQETDDDLVERTTP